MKILAIETSCDETGVAILERVSGDSVTLLGNTLASQIEIHAQYGGVFPALAKRAHAEKIVPLLVEALDQAELIEAVEEPIHLDENLLSFLDEKESTLKEYLVPFLTYYKKPDIDYIAITVGPGLEPALWVGVNAAKALSLAWDIPIIPINHMEGHIVTAAFLTEDRKKFTLSPLEFPLLSLLVSGGHTELVVAEAFGAYKKIGQTRDDAVGEAFDKIARVLGLPYPGGPAVSKLAKEWRDNKEPHLFDLPRPMLHSGDFDFSFSGIKTAVLYTARDLGHEMTDEEKRALAGSFENAVVEVLLKKTMNAIKEYGIQTVIVGGGVAGNTYLRSELTRAVKEVFPEVTLLFPEPWLATDNAVMIGMAAMAQAFSGILSDQPLETIRANGNLSL